ncbi:hypothetical protein [Streptomyces sp. NPDC050485]|uniref:hypothetical protein n=1 Tax=Streptomyces sp. NPDC050485 TaxID=3365617 RepID=UPI0037AFEF8E
MSDYVTDFNVTVVAGSRPKGTVIPPTPSGWKRIDVDVNDGAGGDYVHFVYEKRAGEPPLTDVVFVGEDEAAPSGYLKIPVNVSSGTVGERLFAAITRDPDRGRPITALDVISGKEADMVPPPGYRKVEPDLNKGAKGNFVHLIYRTR